MSAFFDEEDNKGKGEEKNEAGKLKVLRPVEDN